MKEINDIIKAYDEAVRQGKRTALATVVHLFGGFGILSFLIGSIITLYLIGDKIYAITNHLKFRNVTDNPLFFLALVAIIIGVQLFVAGFIGELMTRNSEKVTDYQIRETV